MRHVLGQNGANLERSISVGVVENHENDERSRATNNLDTYLPSFFIVNATHQQSFKAPLIR